MMWIGQRRLWPGVFRLLLPATILLSFSVSRLVAAQTGSRVCAPEGGAGVRVVAVEEDLALRLEDGRLVWPAGVDPPAATRNDPQFGEHNRQSLAAWLAGRLVVGPASAVPDRWGRIVGPLFAWPPAAAVLTDISEWIVASGAARVRPTAAAHACLPALLRAEAAARRGRLGLWADPSYSVLFADAPDSFAGRFGTLQIVEGSVTSIGDSGANTYLNFGPRRGVDFSVVVTRENAKAFERAGLPLHGLLGRSVRVRGLLDDGSGPRIEISDPDWLEMIEGT